MRDQHVDGLIDHLATRVAEQLFGFRIHERYQTALVNAYHSVVTRFDNAAEPCRSVRALRDVAHRPHGRVAPSMSNRRDKQFCRELGAILPMRGELARFDRRLAVRSPENRGVLPRFVVAGKPREQRVDGLADQVSRLIPKEACCVRVHQHDGVVIVNNDDRVRTDVHESRELPGGREPSRGHRGAMFRPSRVAMTTASSLEWAPSFSITRCE